MLVGPLRPNGQPVQRLQIGQSRREWRRGHFKGGIDAGVYVMVNHVAGIP